MKRRIQVSLLAIVCAPLLRDWHLRWGATAAEARSAMPGDELVPDAVVSTRAITIDAPPASVWPWLVQMGQDRAGFYSYDWLERLTGAGIRNADQIVPEWQNLAPGDLMRTYRYVRRFEPLGWIVERVEKDESLVVRSARGNWSWSLLLSTAGERTRLVVRTRARRQGLVGQIVNTVLLEPMHFVMEAGFLRGVRRRVERR